MAHNLKKTTVLDFYGIPGCGKSTISHLLAEKLREDGYGVFEPSYELDHNLSSTKRKIVKLRQYIRYSLAHPVISNKISKLVADNGYSKFSEILSQRINIATKFVALKRTGFDYIIFDEGLCQAALSLSLNEKSTVDSDTNYIELSNILAQKEKNIVIYLKTDVDRAMVRLNDRGEHNSRTDAETDINKRRAMMEQFYCLCEKIGSESNVQTDAGKSVEEIVKELRTRLGI